MMLGDEVETPVADAVLLNQVLVGARAPEVKAQSVRTEHEPISGRPQPIAHVVVVAVSERFVEQIDPEQRLRPVRRVAGADVVGMPASDSAVTLLEVQAHHAGPDCRTGWRDVIALDRADVWIRKRLHHPLHPAGLNHHVLIHLAHNGVPNVPYSEIDRRGRTAALTGQHGHAALRRIRGEDLSRVVSAAIIHDQNFYRTAVVLRDDGVERATERARTVVDRHHEADSRGRLEAHAVCSRTGAFVHTPSTSAYKVSTRPQIRSTA